MKYVPSLIIRIVLAFLLPYKFFAFFIVPATFELTIQITKLFLEFDTAGHSLIIGSYWLNFIEACAAVSAYYLLFFLIILTKNISLKKGVLLFFMGAGMIFLLNLARIEFLIFLLVTQGYNAFQLIHVILWEVVSTIYVAFTWIFLIYFFRIREIPAYSDLKTLIRMIRKPIRPGKQ